MADPTNSAPLAIPWWQSSVQVNLVIAGIAQIASIVLRTVARYVEVDITDSDLQLLFADITQGVAGIFGLVAIIKRQISTIQPLTMTVKAAEIKSEEIMQEMSK